jgi:hypothetical protein
MAESLMRCGRNTRKKYKEWLWGSEFRDTLGAEVSADGI